MAEDRDGAHEPTWPTPGQDASPRPIETTGATSVDDTSAIPVHHTSAFPTYRAPAGAYGAGVYGVPDGAYQAPSAHAGPPAYALGAPALGAATLGAATLGATALPRPPKRRRGGAGVLAGALALGLIGGGAGGYLGATLADERDEPAPTVAEALPVGTTAPTDVTRIAAHALPSVVFIAVGSDRGEGVGSGFVMREDGYIVTNSHVIEGAGENGTIEVTLSDGQVVEAQVVGNDPEYDIAVIKVDQAGLPALEFANSDDLQVGASVVAVGAPLGLDNTVTAGIVSALNRPVIAGDAASTSYINAIQTDAAINPGNSGGPLLDMNGRVVGVNSAIAQIPGEFSGGAAGSIGLGFAIPSRQVEHTATQLIETGKSDHPIIGVMLDMAYTGEGAKVLEEGVEGADPIVDGGPAESAGVQPGDVILEVDGERIDHGQHLIIVLRSHTVGDEVKLLLRDAEGDERTVTMTLQGSE